MDEDDDIIAGYAGWDVERYAEEFVEVEEELQAEWEPDNYSEQSLKYVHEMGRDLASAEPDERGEMLSDLAEKTGMSEEGLAMSATYYNAEIFMEAYEREELILPDQEYTLVEAGGRSIDVAGMADALYAVEKLKFETAGIETAPREAIVAEAERGKGEGDSREKGAQKENMQPSQMARNMAVRGVAAYIARELRGLKEDDVKRVESAVESYYHGEVVPSECTAWQHALAFPHHDYFEASVRTVDLNAVADKLGECESMLRAADGTAWAAIPEEERQKLAGGIVEELTQGELKGLSREDIEGIQSALRGRREDKVDERDLEKSASWDKVVDTLGYKEKSPKERVLDQFEGRLNSRGGAYRAAFKSTLFCSEKCYRAMNWAHGAYERQVLSRAKDVIEQARSSIETIRER